MTAAAAMGVTTIPANGAAAQACVPCQRRGHNCYAHHIVDGEPQCTFCLDGEACIFEQRAALTQKKLAPKKQPAAAISKAVHHRGTEPRREAKAAMANNSPKEKPMQTEPVKTNGHDPQPHSEAKLCGREGCGRKLTRANRSGFCAAHFWDSKRKGPRDRVCDCGNKLRSDNKSGVCKACANTASGKARIAAGAAKSPPLRKARKDGAPGPLPAVADEGVRATRFALQVTAAQLDRYVLGLRELAWDRAVQAMPIELKLQLANFVLEHELEIEEESGHRVNGPSGEVRSPDRPIARSADPPDSADGAAA